MPLVEQVVDAQRHIHLRDAHGIVHIGEEVPRQVGSAGGAAWPHANGFDGIAAPAPGAGGACAHRVRPLHFEQMAGRVAQRAIHGRVARLLPAIHQAQALPGLPALLQLGFHAVHFDRARVVQHEAVDAGCSAYRNEVFHFRAEGRQQVAVCRRRGRAPAPTRWCAHAPSGHAGCPQCRRACPRGSRARMRWVAGRRCRAAA